MAWKQDDDGHLAVDTNGNPIWATETGEDKPVDYTGLTKRLSEANAESKARKEKLRALEERFAPLAEIEDLSAYMEEASRAIEMMKAAPDRDKDIEEQVKSRLEAMSAPLKEQIAARDRKLADKDKALADVTAKYHSVTVKTDVLNSKLLNERIKPEDKPFLLRELVRAGTVNEEGKVVYRADDGEVIYGEDGGPATANEAILAILKNLGIDPATKLMSQDPDTTGSGGIQSRGRSGAGTKNPWKKETWNVTAQNELFLRDRASALNLMKAAGVNVSAYM